MKNGNATNASGLQPVRLDDVPTAEHCLPRTASAEGGAGGGAVGSGGGSGRARGCQLVSWSAGWLVISNNLQVDR